MASAGDKMSKNSEPPNAEPNTKALEKDIANTRSELSQTLGELHGKLNPAVLKDQVMDQFHEAKATIAADLKDAKDALKADLLSELEEVKHGLRNELTVVKDEFREATIGRVEHMAKNAQDTVTQTSKSLLDTLSDNPIPTAIVGIGLGWLFINARARRRASQSFGNARAFSAGNDRYGTVGNGGPRGGRSMGGRVEDYAQSYAHDVAGKAGELAHSLGDNAKRTASSVQESAKQAVKGVSDQAGALLHQADDATHGAREGVTRFAHDAQDAVGHAAHQASEYAHQAGDYASHAGASAMQLARDARQQAGQWEGSFERTLRENPLPVGAVALALGLAVGLSIPSTKVEDEWMGEARDSALEGAESYAQQAIGQLETAATALVAGGEGSDGSSNGSKKQLSQST
ncbi:MAG: DUF3618 domain-containing protein [Polyangiaceae bacterium]